MSAYWESNLQHGLSDAAAWGRQAMRGIALAMASDSADPESRLVFVALVGIGLQALAVYVPALHPLFKTRQLEGWWLVQIVLLSALPLAIAEAAKLLFRRPLMRVSR